MITASYLTLAGSTHGEPPRYSMLERAKAAHAAGIASIGVRLDEPFSISALRYVQIPECEWIDLSQPVTPHTGNDLWAMANLLGVTRVNAGVCLHDVTPGQAAGNLRRLLGYTARLDMTVAVEPVAFGSFPAIAQIADVIRQAGDRAGLLYDFTQVNLAHELDYLHLGRLPVLAEIQACGFRRGDDRDPFMACQDRPLVSESPVMTRQWLRAVRDKAPGAPVSYENPNKRLREMPLLEMAEAAAADMALLA